MSLADVAGHQEQVSALQRAIASERVAKAYLFVGPPNVGKTLVAKEFAKAANCEELPERPSADEVDSCDRCHTCVRMEQENHPDLVVVRPAVAVDVRPGGEDDEGEQAGPAEDEAEEGQDVRVVERTAKRTVYVELPDALIQTDRILDVIRHCWAKAASARRKFVIITSAETMNAEAENRLLKTLEEPPPGTTFVLTTANPSALLETTLSRCQAVKFQALSAAGLREALRTGFPEAEPELIEAVTAMAGGRYGRARWLMGAPELVSLRSELLDLAAATCEANLVQCLGMGERLMELAQQWWEVVEQAQDRPRELSEEDSRLRAKALGELGRRSPDRIRRIQISELLDILQTWYRDLMLLRAAPESGLVVNTDRSAQLGELAPLHSPNGLAWASQVIEETRRDLSVHNANFRLACQVLLLKLMAARRRR